MCDCSVRFAWAAPRCRAHGAKPPLRTSVAEAEGRAISERTIAALRQAKKRGTALGATNPKSRNLTVEAAAKGAAIGAKAMREKARAHYAEAIPIVVKLRQSGLSFGVIADCMNAEGYVTQSRKPWTAMTAKWVPKWTERKIVIELDQRGCAYITSCAGKALKLLYFAETSIRGCIKAGSICSA